jgi:hypothetical protein
MAASSSISDASPSLDPSSLVTAEHDHIANGSHASYQRGQLTWDGGKLGDEDIITVTSNGEGENERIIWSLAPVDPASDPAQAPFEPRKTTASSLPPDFLEKHRFQALPDHLDPETHSIYVLVSTRSGTGLAFDFFHNVLRPLLRGIGLADSRYEVIETENAGSVKAFTHSTLLEGANRGKKQTLVLLSGDGGIVDTINGLLDWVKLRYFFSDIDCPRRIDTLVAVPTQNQ